MDSQNIELMLEGIRNVQEQQVSLREQFFSNFPLNPIPLPDDEGPPDEDNDVFDEGLDTSHNSSN